MVMIADGQPEDTGAKGVAASFTQGPPDDLVTRVGSSYGTMATGLTSYVERNIEERMENTGLYHPDKMTPAEIKQKYGFDTDGPMTELSAAGVSAYKQADAVEKQAYKNAGIAGTFGPKLIAGLADPLNYAIPFMPELGATRALATTMGDSAIARFGARAAVGGAEAAVVNTPSILAQGEISKSGGMPWDRNDYLMNLGMTYGMGALIHPLIGAFADRVKAMKDMPLDVRGDALQTSIANAQHDEAINPVVFDREAPGSQKLSDYGQVGRSAYAEELQAQRAEPQVMGATGDAVKQMQVMTEDASKKIEQEPVPDVANLKTVNDGMEQQMLDKQMRTEEITPEEKAVADLRDQSDLYQKGLQAAGLCLGAG